MLKNINVSSKIRFTRNLTIILITISLSVYIGLFSNNIKNANAHNFNSQPMELFSLFNNTSPTIDGIINFNATSLSEEWSSAAVYPLFDKNFDINSKLLIQNTNSNFFIGLDLTNYQNEEYLTTWGAAIYLDRDHNGILSNFDRVVKFLNSTTQELVIYYQYDEATKDWLEIESGPPGVSLTSSNILIDTAFTHSFFENQNHRQYEIKLPFTILNSEPGKIIGIGFEAFTNLDANDEEICWPYISATPCEIRYDPKKWGDIYFCLSNKYEQYSIEENFNIKTDAVGINNGTTITTGDINGDGDLELIVASNRSVTDDSNLMAIYDYNNGELYRNWSSWTTSHQSKMFLVKGIATNDFDGNGEDEIYAVGEDSRILCFRNWSSSLNDFLVSEYAFSHTTSLMGYIAIGDVTLDGLKDIVVGDQSGYLSILEYSSSTNSFSYAKKSPFRASILGTPINRVHAISIGDIDNDTKNELLFQCQISSSDIISTTTLLIYQKLGVTYGDNSQDNLPSESSSITEDCFGHTMVVADIDNDGEFEILTIGKNYLKIFGSTSFNLLEPPLQLLLNDGYSEPLMSGGAAVADIDGDTNNELIFSCNNGTIFVLNVTDSGGNNLSYNIEWSNDFGTSFGIRNSINVFDIDKDDEKEIITGDTIGQIMFLGKSNPPTIAITSPISGASFSSSPVKITWEALDEYALHHIDIKVGGIFIGRVAGFQESYLVPISLANNLVEVIAFDTNGKNASYNINIKYSVFAPEVHITFPENYFKSKAGSIIIKFENYDPNDDFNHYEIWVNDDPMEENWKLPNYSIPLNNDGIYNITIVGVDDATNKGTSSIFVIIDNSEPTISMISPISGSYVKTSEIELHWSSYDALSGISHFDIKRDGVFVTSTTNNFQNVILDMDKTFQFEVIAYDNVGNTKSTILIITKDTVQPNLVVINPISGSITNNSLTNVVWSANDNVGGSGIHHTEVVVNQVTKYIGIEESASIDMGGDGLKEILVTLLDRAGNSKSVFLEVTVDVQSPYIEIIYPYDNFNTGLDFITLNWFVQEEGTGVKEYQIYIDGNLNTTIADSSINTWLLNIPLNKTSTIMIKAIDYTNKTSSDFITINQNLTCPTIGFTNPIGNLTYLSNTQLELNWTVANIENLTKFEIYLNENKTTTINDPLIRNYILNLTSLIEYVLYKISILGITSTNLTYIDIRWIILDLTPPEISILTPLNNSIIIDYVTYLQWSGFDLGVGIQNYILKINNEEILKCDYNRNYKYLSFENYDEVYQITVEAYDNTQNYANTSILLMVYLQNPEISTDLPPIYYTKTGDIQFNFSIINPGLGVKRYIILLDDNQLYIGNFYDDLILEPYSILINITENDYDEIEGLHQLTIALIDFYNRETIKTITIIVDFTLPNILSSISIDTQIISNNAFELALYDEISSKNNHTITITVTDNYGIDKVFLTITGNGVNDTFEMICEGQSRAQILVYFYTIDLNSYDLGAYNITITVIDLAKNTNKVNLKMTLVPPEKIPWFQGKNLIYILLGLIFFSLHVVAAVVFLREPIQNRKWKEEIIAVLFIQKNGLTCVYVPYYPKIIQEEQLIGGAMVAIQGILHEITGEREKSKVETLEIGSKNLLLYPGNFGYGIVIIKKVKPIHKKLTENFTKKFEKIHGDSLKSTYYVDSSSYDDSLKLVEEFFGPIKSELKVLAEKGLVKQLLDIKETKDAKESSSKDLAKQQAIEEISPIDKLVKELSREAKNHLIKVIEQTPKVILALVELKINEAEKYVSEIYEGFEFLLKVKKTNKELTHLLETMMSVLKEISSAIEFGHQGNRKELQTAIEKATKLWFEEIAEKWSNIT